MNSRIPIFPLIRSVLPRLQYIPVVSRGLWRKHISVKGDLKNKEGFALKAPYQISLRITNRCNQHCAICGQFGAKGYMHKSGAESLLNELTIKQYKNLVDEVIPYRPLFYITGGEALLYKDLLDLTEYIKQKNGYVYVITNGALLSKYAKDIVSQKWDLLTVSLDGPEKIHDQCRGVPGTFKKTTNGINIFMEERKKQGGNLPYFILSATISAANQHHLDEVFEVASDIKPDCLILYLSWFTTEEIGLRHQAILKQELGMDAVTWKSYIGQNVNIDTQKLHDTLKKISKRKYPFPWFHIPSIPLDQIHTYYREPENFLGYGPCVAPYLMVDIMPNGDVVTCRDYIDVKVGNITQKPLLEIWNDKPFRKFRMLLQKHGGTLPQCSRCCGLMGF